MCRHMVEGEPARSSADRERTTLSFSRLLFLSGGNMERKETIRKRLYGYGNSEKGRPPRGCDADEEQAAKRGRQIIAPAGIK